MNVDPAYIDRVEQGAFKLLAEGKVFRANAAMFAAHLLQPINMQSSRAGESNATGRDRTPNYSTFLKIREYVSAKARVRYRTRTVWPDLRDALSAQDHELLRAAGGTRYVMGQGQQDIVWWPGQLAVRHQQLPSLDKAHGKVPPMMPPAELVRVVADQGLQAQAAADANPNLVKVQAVLVKRWAAGPAILAGEVERFREGLCEKCGGLGFISSYAHVDGGQCWDCGGSGLKD